VRRWIALSIAAGLALAGPAYAEDKGHGGGHGVDVSQVLVGEATEYKPLVEYEFKGMKLSVPLSIAGRVEGLNSFPVDSKGTDLETGVAGDMQVRLGLSFNTVKALAPFNIGVYYEHDVLTGPIAGDPVIAGTGYPNSHHVEHQLRKAYMRASMGNFLHLQGGLMTSHWGLGLLANDGAHGWHPGSAHFADPRGGDRTARLMLATGPMTPLGVVFAFGHDWVQGDDVMLDGDEAHQFIAAISLGKGRSTSMGFYGVYRIQKAEDGDETRVAALDWYGKTSHKLGCMTLTVEVESAVIIGSTELGSTPEFPEHDVLQIGLAARAALSATKWGAVLDFLYASGDANFGDAQQNAFKPDPNYELSLFAYRYVLAGLTARAAHTAFNKDITGYANEDLNRLPTRESASNTIAIFPRAWWRPLTGLEVYGGPLFAFTAVPLADPFHSKTAADSGGAARNAFAAAPGSYLGTELNVGARYRLLMSGTELTAGIEGGVFLPGSALEMADGSAMDPIGGGRLVARYRF